MSAAKGSGKAKKAAAGETKRAKAARPRKAAKAAKVADGAVRSWDGKKAGTTTLDASGLGERVKLRLLASAVRMYEANRRQGTLKVKTRGETNYTERKPYKQKGTGNARRGDFNSPLLRGGGVIFGPHPRDFGFALPRKALREALRSALVGKVRDGEVATLKGAGFTEPSTKSAAAALKGLGCDGSAVIVLPEDRPVMWKSFRNIPRVAVVRASDLNAHQVLAHKHVVFVDDAFDVVQKRLQRATAGTAAGESP